MRSEFETLEQYQNSVKEFNESTRKSYEEFIQLHGSDREKLQLRFTPYTDKKGGYGSFDLDFGLKVWQHQQSKVDELQKQVDAVKGLAQTLWEKSEEKHQQGKVWESKTLGECADEILDVLEQALKGGES